MHIDTIVRGQTLHCRRTGRSGKVIAVDPSADNSHVRITLDKTGKRINVLPDKSGEVRWITPRRSHLSLRSIGCR